jgi:putative transposase
MPELVLSILSAIRVFFQDRGDVALEVLALRQQLAVLKRKRPRPPLNALDRLFWTTLSCFWPRWTEVLEIVKSKTVVGWHRAGFRLYWRWHGRARGGRPKITAEIRALIRQMAKEKCRMGCAQDSRRTLEIGSGRLRTNRGSIPAANASPRGSEQKLVGFPGESS